MSPESISSYFKEEAINDCLRNINNRPIPVIVECENGEEFPVTKAYRVSGRAAAIKILIGGEGKTNDLLDKIKKLEELVEIYKKEEKNHSSELSKAEQALDDLEDSQEREFERIQSALDTAQEKLGFGTAQRKIEDQIDDLFQEAADRISELEDEVARLTVDNTALAWNIEGLEKQIESTNLEIIKLAAEKANNYDAPSAYFELKKFKP